jgi:hypothetical protein
MKRYNCQHPDCNYSTNDRHAIHLHHINPVENGGIDDECNRVWLCPNHHMCVYIPESKKGIHSKKSDGYIIFKGKFLSTGGIVLEYEDNYGKNDFCYIKNSG